MEIELRSGDCSLRLRWEVPIGWLSRVQARYYFQTRFSIAVDIQSIAYAGRILSCDCLQMLV